MIGRRGLLGAGVGLALLPPQALADAGIEGVPLGGTLLFDVYREGSRIGTHRMTFSRSATGLTIAAKVRFHVGIGPVTLYRYRYRANERWDGGRFTGINTVTDDDGTRRALRARRVAGGISVKATGRPDAVLGSDAKPLTHWNRSTLRDPLFNPETGKPMRVTVADVPGRDVALASGKTEPATGVRLTGDADLTDWYDAHGVWCALQATVKKDGSKLDYRLSG